MKPTNLMTYMVNVIHRFKEEGRMGTAHVYQSTLNRIADFTKGEPPGFKQLTPHWLMTFQEYLLNRQLRWNTVSTYMRMLRAVYFRAMDEGLAPLRPRLFKGVYTGTKVTVKRALGEEVLRRMETPLPSSARLDKARMLFLLSFMLRGIPFVDIAYMRRCDLDGSTLTYRRRKTGAWLTVHVEPEAMSIIRRLESKDSSSPYLFPFIRHPGQGEYRQYQNALRSFNHSLKELGGRIGAAGGLSSYCARHSWATIANHREYQQELISNAMGHSSVKVTEIYFKKHTTEKIDRMNRSLISYVFGNG